MTTSGSKDFELNTNEIINAAYRKIRALRLGETASSVQVSNARQALNAMVKTWRGEGISLWDSNWSYLVLHASTVVEGSDGNNYKCIRNHTSSSATYPITGSNWQSYWTETSDDTTTTWASGQSYVSICHYFLDAYVIDVEKAFVREDDTDVTMEKISEKDYFELGNKSTEGKPTLYMFRKQATPELFLYPLPDSTTDYDINILKIEYSDDFDNGANTADFPSEFTQALIYNLAVVLHQEYGTLNISEFQILKSEANEYKYLAKKMNEESGSAFFKPEMRY